MSVDPKYHYLIKIVSSLKVSGALSLYEFLYSEYKFFKDSLEITGISIQSEKYNICINMFYVEELDFLFDYLLKIRVKNFKIKV